jgi:hypothetical protein
MNENYIKRWIKLTSAGRSWWIDGWAIDGIRETKDGNTYLLIGNDEYPVDESFIEVARLIEVSEKEEW